MRYIIQPDKTSSQEYQIFDVLHQKTVANGLDKSEAADGANSRNIEWEKEKDDTENENTRRITSGN